ncbi:hypothetical protein BGZ46_009314 [Entomortierella lignicola]|nr:hypothetical protein BGZ46_009314 [Entomortierella lignicola]
MPVVQNLLSSVNSMIPRVHTSEGLRQLQLMTLGLFVIYFLLHVSLFMDNMVYHVFFANEIGSVILYLFFPVKYEIRPVRTLKLRFYFLIILATFWIMQPSLLLLPDNSSTPLPSLFDTREVITAHVSKTLNQIQIENILKQGGKVEDGFQGQPAYAVSLAAAMQCEAWLAVVIAVFISIEAMFVWNKADRIDEAAELALAERKKRENKATSASSSEKKKSD